MGYKCPNVMIQQQQLAYNTATAEVAHMPSYFQPTKDTL